MENFASLKVYRNNELIGPKVKTNEWFTTSIRTENDGTLSIIIQTKDRAESWSVSFGPDEVEMIIDEAFRPDGLSYRELSSMINRLHGER